MGTGVHGANDPDGAWRAVSLFTGVRLLRSLKVASRYRLIAIVPEGLTVDTKWSIVNNPG